MPQKRGFKDGLKAYIEVPYVELHEEGKSFPGGGNGVSKDLEQECLRELIMWFN